MASCKCQGQLLAVVCRGCFRGTAQPVPVPEPKPQGQQSPPATHMLQGCVLEHKTNFRGVPCVG